MYYLSVHIGREGKEGKKGEEEMKGKEGKKEGGKEGTYTVQM